MLETIINELRNAEHAFLEVAYQKHAPHYTADRDNALRRMRRLGFIAKVCANKKTTETQKTAFEYLSCLAYEKAVDLASID